jgi:hypothetical protein
VKIFTEKVKCDKRMSILGRVVKQHGNRGVPTKGEGGANRENFFEDTLFN